MAQRRDRPALQTSGQTWQVRLPGGMVMEVPSAAPSERADRCCFCGGPLGDDAATRVLLTARWASGDDEETRSWSAHRSCLAEHLHESVAHGLDPSRPAEEDDVP